MCSSRHTATNVAPDVTRLRRRERGQSVVEIALVTPLLLVLILATVDLGWALRANLVTINAAREGARIGALSATSADIKAKAVDASDGLLTLADITVDNAGGAPGTSVTVAADYNHDYLTPLGPLLSILTGGSLPDPLPMSTTTKMRIQ